MKEKKSSRKTHPKVAEKLNKTTLESDENGHKMPERQLSTPSESDNTKLRDKVVRKSDDSFNFRREFRFSAQFFAELDKENRKREIRRAKKWIPLIDEAFFRPDYGGAWVSFDFTDEYFTEFKECRNCYETYSIQIEGMHCKYCKGVCTNCLIQCVKVQIFHDCAVSFLCPVCDLSLQTRNVFRCLKRFASAQEAEEIISQWEKHSICMALGKEEHAKFCPNCNYAVINDDCSTKLRGKTVQCLNTDCNTQFCSRCGVAHEPETSSCPDRRRGYRKLLRSPLKKRLKTKKCPQCRLLISKDDGCNHMTCSRCECDFCWICLYVEEDGETDHDFSHGTDRYDAFIEEIVDKFEGVMPERAYDYLQSHTVRTRALVTTGMLVSLPVLLPVLLGYGGYKVTKRGGKFCWRKMRRVYLELRLERTL